MAKLIRVLALTAGDEKTPSTRYRVLKLMADMACLGVEIVPITPRATKVSALVSYVRSIISAHEYDVVFIQKRLLPSVVLQGLRHRSRVLVLDIDDAMHVSQDNPEMASWQFGRLDRLLRACDGVIAGNEYLAEFASLYSQKVYVVPTGVDTTRWNPTVLKLHSGIVLGWIGTKSNLQYLEGIMPTLLDLMANYQQIRLRVVCDRPLALVHDRIEFVDWSLEGELDAVSIFDIGLMPLPDNRWTQGKCGFKALQMMSLGIPVVLSPIGVNRGFVGQSGPAFGAVSSMDWYEILARLVTDEGFRANAGSAAREFTTRNYGLSLTSRMLANALQNLAGDVDA